MPHGARLTNIPDKYDAGTFRTLVRDIESRLRRLEELVGPYTVSNYVETRTLDMGTAGAVDIGNFLATLVSDLQKAGRLASP